MKNRVLPIFALSALFIASCGKVVVPGTSQTGDTKTSVQETTSQTTSESSPVGSSADLSSTSESDFAEDLDYGTFQIATEVVGGYTQSGNTYTIHKAGTYKIAGTLTEGRIIIETDDVEDVVLELKNCYIGSSENSPIYCLKAEALKIKSQKTSVNYIIDGRAEKTVDDDAQGGGAIYSKCDTNFTGSGTLNVLGSYNNGIHVTKDLKVKTSTINVQSANHALKGNDSVTITSGNITLYAIGGDGIKTDDSDISSKGNQRGIVKILGGETNIYSWGDGIDASYDAIVENGTDEDTGETTIPTLNIYTNKFADLSTSVIPEAEGFYIRTKSAAYSADYRYAIQFKDSSEKTSWANTTYSVSANSYAYYTCEFPENAISFKVFKFKAGAQNSDTSYECAMTDFATKNSFYNTFTFSESGNTITEGGWCDYTTSVNASTVKNGPGGGGGWGGPGGGGFGGEGNTDKATDSAKGIKANNAIAINGGVTYIKAYDDGLHANYYQDSVLLENGEKGTGDVNITGGTLKVYASDDGLHADGYMNIKGGNVTIESAYEGIEGSVINVSGGVTKVYATDDGLNAANKANLTPSVNITGGFLDVAVNPSGDTDGIDSNGDYKQSGGIVVTKGPNNTMMAALDWGDNNNSATVSAGTLIVFGRPGGTVKTSGSVKSSNTSKTRSGKVSFTVDGVAYEADCYNHSYSNQYLYTDQTVVL